MKTKVLLLQVLSMILVLTVVAPAQNADTAKTMEKAAKQAYQDLLKETDKNSDGKISKTEFYAIWKDKKTAEEKYVFWDTNNDGYITEEEYVKAVLSISNKKKK